MNASVRRRRRRRTAVAATALLAALALGVVWPIDRTPVASSIAGSRAIVNPPVRRTLPDGSIVELNDQARIAVDYAGAWRRVALLQGEAHFQVAKNPDRPFVVTALGVDVRAVGTAFSVQIDRASVDVLVTEGQVAVAASPGPTGTAASSIATGASTPRPPVLVAAGNHVGVEVTALAVTPMPVRLVSAAELAERLAWRVPRLEFNYTPLIEVLPALNRYSGSHLTLATPELGQLKLSGNLRADNVPVFLQILESSYGVKAEHRAGGEIVLSRGP